MIKKTSILVVGMLVSLIPLLAQENSGSHYSSLKQTDVITKITQKSPLNVFPTGTTGSIGIDYDTQRGGFWIANEAIGSSISLIDTITGAVLMEVDYSSAPAGTDTKTDGIDVLSNGNLLLTDYGGSGSIIDDYIFEINPDDGSLVNYWPTNGSMNTCTNGAAIMGIMDIVIGENGNAFVTNVMGNDIYEIELLPGSPGTWTLVATHSAPSSISLVLGIDRLCDKWVFNDYGSTTVVLTDDSFVEISSVSAVHTNTSISGVCFMEGSDPLRIAIVDYTTNNVGIFGSDLEGKQTVNFNIGGEIPVLSGIIIEINGQTILTDPNGDVSIELTPGDYAYTVYACELYTDTLVLGFCDTIQENIVVVDLTNPEINCAVNQIRDADETHFYTVQSTEFDPLDSSDNCEVESIENDFNYTSTLENALLPEGTTTITWTIKDVTGNENTCSFDVLVNSFVGVETLKQRGILLFPNPTNGMIAIEFTENDIKKLIISDLTGTQIIEKTDLKRIEHIDLTAYSRGIYILTILTDNEPFTTKIDKE